MTFTRHGNATRRLVGVALLALLLAQWTALSHAIAHAPLGATSALAVQDDGTWGHEADTPDCRLVDHLLIGQATGAEPPAMAWLQPATAVEPTRRLPIVCSAPLRTYEARGPPRA